MAKVVKGFTLETGDKVHDHIIMNLDKDMVSTMMHNLTAIEYNKWKLLMTKKAFRERNHDNDYSDDSMTRLRYTQKTIQATQDILDEYEKSV